MKIRHKVPTLVSMWMLDVFCCALGCVTLLWLLKTREAGTVIAQNASIQAELDDSRTLLADATTANIMLGSQLDETTGQLALVRTERDAAARRLALTDEQVKTTAAELARARVRVDDVQRALAMLRASSEATADELAKKRTELEGLSRKADDMAKKSSDLEVLLREKERARSTAVRQVADLTARLDDATLRANQLAKAEARVKQVEHDLGDQASQIIDLQGEKAKLADKLKVLQMESDQKFAGIATSGRRVVFLVDMSGSMDRTDVNTVEPTKWPKVQETLLKIMRSHPNLEKYQVVLFSDKVRYLFKGTEGTWLDFHPAGKDGSIEQVRRAMAVTHPEGDTAMYAAFEEVFKYRYKGMDNIYLFSDGLPTTGPGLEGQSPTLSDQQRSEVLGRHVLRKLRSDWNAGSDPSLPKVRINSIGFFYESPDLGAFLWTLSRANDGSFVGMSKP